MANEIDDKDDIVSTAKKRFQLAKDRYAQTRLLAIEDTRFVMGDSDNGYQWPVEMRRNRLQEQKVCLTVNTTAQHCNQIINNIRQNRPTVRVSPVDNFSDKKTAEILAGLIRNIQVASHADDAHDLAAEHAVYGGEGYWRVITEYESPVSFNQVIRIKSIQNPQLVYIDPDCKEMDKSDAEWGFIFEDLSKERAKREYKDIDIGAEVLDSKSGWVTHDTVRIAEYFYCTYEKAKAVLLSDGRAVLKDEVKLGDVVVQERETEVKKWKWCKLVGGYDKCVDEKDWPGKYLPIIACLGKEVNVNGEVILKGVVRDLKDPARILNYAYSETVQSLAIQNKVPYVASSEAIEGYEDQWQSANTSNLAVLPFNAYDDSGNPLPRPERQAPPILPAAQVQLLQLSQEQMRAASGQQNANFGIKSEASSGVGIQRLKAQGEIATFHFPDNLSRALRYEGCVLLDLIQQVYDTQRVIRILGLDGAEETALLNPEMPEAYAERDIEDDIEKIFNPNVGEYDVVIDTGPSYQTQRQEAFAALIEMSARNPMVMQAAGDLVMKAADFPMADQLAKRFEKTIPPELRDEKGNQQAQIQAQNMELQQQLQQAGAAIEAMQAELEKLEQEKQAKTGEIQAKMQLSQMDSQFKAEQYETEIAFKAQQAEIEAALQREKAQQDAQLAIDKALIDAETKLKVAEINAQTDLQIAGMNAAQSAQNAVMAHETSEMAAGEGEYSEKPEAEKPKRYKKVMKIQAPSGQIYVGEMADEEIED